MIKEDLKKSIKGVFNDLEVTDDLDIELIAPPKVEMGDFAFGCFELAKILKKAPIKIAEEIAEKIKNKKNNTAIETVQADGPYVNFKIKNKILFGEIYDKIILNKNIKKVKEGDGKKIMVEYLSPNTNKPLHLGHLRNGSLGMAVSNLLKENNNQVVRANLINDRGIHICKSMLAWKLFGNGETPESTGMKGDHFVGKYYVKYSKEVEKNPELENQAKKMLQKWEEGEEEVLALWEKMNKWVLAGFEKSFQELGFEFDVIYKESETYKFGKDLIKDGLVEGIFQKENNGAVTFVLSDEFGLDKEGNNKKITVLREDGTSVYITQDLGTAVYKTKQYDLDQSVYVVGSEQDYYFKSLFEILKALGYSWAKNNLHLSYGMVYLPDGRMKSREGKVVDADDLVVKIKKLAEKGIIERRGGEIIKEDELDSRAKKIALGAIKFYLLKVNPTQIIHFNPEESLSFEGFTGPYCQYAYARGTKLLRDAKISKENKIEAVFSKLGSVGELRLVQKILESEDKITKAGENFNPSLVAVHIFELAKAFNQFYHDEAILKAEKSIKMARLALVQMFLQTIKKELNLLGIEVLEEM